MKEPAVSCGRPLVQAVEKVLPAKGFGGKDSWKGNRQGSLSLKSTTFFPAGRIECTDRKEEKWEQTGNHGFRTAGWRGKKGKKRDAICGYIGCNGQNLF